MNEDLAKQIADRVLRDNQFWIAVVGLIGSIVGGLLVIGGNLLLNWLQHRDEKSLDDARKKLLEKMLNASDWRKLSTLFRVIGANRDTTTRLLIELGARGSEKQRPDGEEVWGLISKHPLEQIE
ncbi:MAG TPA: hypothetical protein VE822_13720 [Candidatus Elarobacter sp.]|nr:hypothetical protein [Candidatus Elarobacter sp.]